MSIREFFTKPTAFDPETIVLLSSALETAWDSLKKSNSTLGTEAQSEETRSTLAKRIIERAQMGERDVHRLVEDALVHLAFGQTPPPGA